MNFIETKFDDKITLVNLDLVMSIFKDNMGHYEFKFSDKSYVFAKEIIGYVDNRFLLDKIERGL